MTDSFLSTDSFVEEHVDVFGLDVFVIVGLDPSIVVLVVFGNCNIMAGCPISDVEDHSHQSVLPSCNGDFFAQHPLRVDLGQVL